MRVMLGPKLFREGLSEKSDRLELQTLQYKKFKYENVKKILFLTWVCGALEVDPTMDHR